MKEPLQLASSEKYVSGLLIYDEWNEFLIVAEFSDAFMYFEWDTTV
jgi:hypothetical protein